MANTGGGGDGPLTCTAPPFSALIVSPVLMLSSRPSATVSPAFAGPALHRLLAAQREYAGGALIATLRAGDDGALAELAGEHADER